MGLWPRIGVTALAAAAASAGSWQGAKFSGAGQGAAAAVATIVATVVVTLGAVWVSRARDRADPGPGVGAVVSASRSGQAIGAVKGVVFGPESNFTGAVIITGPGAVGRGAALGPAGVPPAGPGVAGGRVVVGEIPQEPTAYQDRADVLAALTGPPTGGRVSVVFAVTGLRGVGKSQIAAACARQRLGEGWPVVAWLNAEDREGLLAGYAQLAAALGLAADEPDSAEAALRVRHWLEAGGEGCLIVLDNAASADVLRPFLPAAGWAQVIVTSSRSSLAGLGVPVPVGVFSGAEAAGFLAERTGLADEAGALRVAEELGCLPLALAQAGAVIAGQHLDYPTYLRRLAGARVGDYLTRPEEDPYPRGTAEAIAVSVHAAWQEDTSGLGRQVLGVIALLSSAGAPRTLIAGSSDADPEAADMALQRLAAWSLVTWSVDASAVSAHRLVMRVVREQAAADGSLAAAARDAIRGLKAMPPPADEAWRHPVLMQEYVTQAAALADHLDALPGLITGQVEEDVLGLLADAGWYLSEISDLSRATPILQRTLVDRERVLGADHPDTLTSRNNLAYAYASARRLGEAIPLFSRTLADRERVLGADHPDTLTSRNNLAFGYKSAGRLSEAIPLYERTLADRERVLGADHPQTLTSRNNLAGAYRAAGRLGEAIPLFERTLADRDRVLGADHPQTLASRNNLAYAYESAGRLGEAIPLFERTLADSERVLGADHPQTLASRNNLAYAYESAGRLGEAIPLFERTLADCERVLGADHPDTLGTRASLERARVTAVPSTRRRDSGRG